MADSKIVRHVVYSSPPPATLGLLRSNFYPPAGGWDSANPRAVDNRPYDMDGVWFRDAGASVDRYPQDPSTRGKAAAQDDAVF